MKIPGKFKGAASINNNNNRKKSLNNQRRIENPVKYLRSRFLQKQWQPLTIFAKHFILGVSQGYEYASDKTKQMPGALSFISHKI